MAIGFRAGRDNRLVGKIPADLLIAFLAETRNVRFWRIADMVSYYPRPTSGHAEGDKLLVCRRTKGIETAIFVRFKRLNGSYLARQPQFVAVQQYVAIEGYLWRISADSCRTGGRKRLTPSARNFMGAEPD
jgi:hypothetical protein